MLYLDLDNFKAFNDVYGFEAGDEMIKILSQTLKQVIGEHGFVGHVGLSSQKTAMGIPSIFLSLPLP